MLRPVKCTGPTAPRAAATSSCFGPIQKSLRMPRPTTSCLRPSSWVRTRGPDIRGRRGRRRADRAARMEGVSSTAGIGAWPPATTCCGLRAALIAGTPWLDIFYPGCGTPGNRPADPRPAPLASVGTLVLGLPPARRRCRCRSSWACARGHPRAAGARKRLPSVSMNMHGRM
jgi:hypothetical protein